MSAGCMHTAIWTMEGNVYTFGNGDGAKKGQLGHGGCDDELVPRVVDALAGKSIAGVAAGGDHTVVWTTGGEVYTFGTGRRGQLGHADQYERPGMERMERVPRVLRLP